VSAVVVELTRGPLVENIYRGDAAVVDGRGRVLFQVGDPAKVTFWRSSAKPIQAMPIMLSGAAEAFGFGPQHLAIFAASHNGEVSQTETVQDALALAGLGADLLQCGAHAPFDRETNEALTLLGLEPGAVHNNCSGKHTGMLALAKHLGLPLADYLDPQSQVQQVILANVADVVGLPAADISIGTDGCGVPVFGLPLRNMAWSFARLADPDAMPAGKAEAGRQFRDAMLTYPHLVAGRRRICTELMELPGRRFVAKSGAEGVYCVGVLPSAAAESTVLQAAGAVGGVGIAVKAEDGDTSIRHMLVVEIMRQLGVLTAADQAALARYGTTVVKNHAGKVVGEKRTVFSLQTGGAR